MSVVQKNLLQARKAFSLICGGQHGKHTGGAMPSTPVARRNINLTFSKDTARLMQSELTLLYTIFFD